MASKPFPTQPTNNSPNSPSNRQESHRIYLQIFSPRSSPAASSPIHRHDSHEIHAPSYPTTIPGAPYQFSSSSSSLSASYTFSSNTGAADVKRPSRPHPSTSTASAVVRLTDRAVSKDVTELLRGKFGLSPNSVIDGTDDEADALVIVGTIESTPPGYIQFEHEMGNERSHRSFQRRDAGKEDISASTDTVRASGGEKNGSALPLSRSSLDDSALGSSSVGLDLSSSRGADSLPPVVREKPLPNPRRTAIDEYNEPMHMVRTVRPDERPLFVRDEMIKRLIQRRLEAREEMGLGSDSFSNDDKSLLSRRSFQPMIRWFFLPGGGNTDGTSKIQSIPSYIDLDGYCTGDEDDSNSDNDSVDDESKTNCFLSPAVTQLTKERRRIAMLRDLVDPTFVISGYLLLRSHEDCNVWRRVFCVLGDDRLWIIRRMKALKDHRRDRNIGDSFENVDNQASIRIGRHSYMMLHRSLLLESGDGVDSSFGKRLPNTFRIIPLDGPHQTFRAFNSSSFKIWTSSLAEKITLKHCHGLMELAGVIAEDEAAALSKRLDDVAVSPLLDEMLSFDRSSLELPTLSDVVRFGSGVAEYKRLHRHLENALHRPGKLTVRSIQEKSRYDENVTMVSAVWEDARVLASKSAQLLHAFAARRHASAHENELNENTEESRKSPSDLMESLLGEQKALQITLGKRWDSIGESTSEDGHLTLPPVDLFDCLLRLFQSVCMVHAV